jgi:hypothetical protein
MGCGIDPKLTHILRRHDNPIQKTGFLFRDPARRMQIKPTSDSFSESSPYFAKRIAYV